MLHIIDILEEKGANIVYSDPHIPSFKRRGKEYNAVELAQEQLEKADIVIVTTDHTAFDYDLIGRFAPAVLDTRNALKNVAKPKRYEIL